MSCAGAVPWFRIALAGSFAALAVAACATGGAGVDVSDDGNLVESTSVSGTGGTSGTGGSGGVLVTSSSSTTTVATTGNGGAGGTEPPCDEDPCRVMNPQCGCPSGQKCTLQPSIYTRGCRDAGAAIHGEECTNDLDCAAGTYCMLLGGHRVCRDFCESNADCVAPGGICTLELNLSPGPEKWCSDDCDPITNTGCPVAGSKCEFLQDDQQNFYTICIGAGAGTQGTSCSTLNDCAAQFGCLTVSSVTSCHQYCDYDNPSCPVGTCIPFDPPVFIGTKQYGGCN